jgi:NADPH:quinone reductase
VLASPDNPEQFGAPDRELTGGTGVAAVYDGIGATTFDASLASSAVRGTLVFGAAGPGRLPAGRPAATELGRIGVPDAAYTEQ